ncbi:MAG: hypothetical protein ACLGHN_01305 [Bacteriovoracia bacterium]
MKPYWILALTFLILFFKDRNLLAKTKPRYDRYIDNPLFYSFLILIIGAGVFWYLRLGKGYEDHLFNRLISFLIYGLAGMYGILINKGMNETPERLRFFSFYSTYTMYAYLAISIVTLIYPLF